MSTLQIVSTVIVALLLLLLSMAIKIVRHYEQGVVFRLGRVQEAREPGLRAIIPCIDVMHQVSKRVIKPVTAVPANGKVGAGTSTT